MDYIVEVENEDRILKRLNNPRVSSAETFEYRIPRATSEKRPVVVGFGPAGMFAALVLAEAGLKPIVLERGLDAVTRRERVKRFWKTGELDQECNAVREGGAGTFRRKAHHRHENERIWLR